MTTRPSVRHHDLDALRSFAMMLGIVLHAGTFLIPIGEFWPVQDAWVAATPPAQNLYAFAISAIHGFRMPVFFLLSGFFTAMLWRSRGVGRLVRHRVERICLPLAVCSLTVIPVTAWLFEREPDDFDLASWPVAWIDSFHHLWFLWYLLLLAAAFVALVKCRATFRSAWWWLLIPLSVLLQHLMLEAVVGSDTPDPGLPPTPRVLGYYGAFFLFGAFFFQRGMTVRSWWAGAMPIALFVVLPGAIATVHAEMLFTTVPPWAPIAASILDTAYAWVMCMGLMGLFRWIASSERFWIRYLSDSSYWLYIGHLPLVLIMQRLVLDWQISVHLKFLLICTVVVGVLLATYQWGVRYTLVGRILNGPRVRRVA